MKTLCIIVIYEEKEWLYHSRRLLLTYEVIVSKEILSSSKESNTKPILSCCSYCRCCLVNCRGDTEFVFGQSVSWSRKTKNKIKMKKN